MLFRIATLNLEQDHKRWDARRPLIVAEIARLKPDIQAFNEICVPRQTARGLRARAAEATGVDYALVQQTKTNGLSEVEGEALLTRFPVIETGNLDYQARDMVALVARLLVGETPVDVYVTHLYKSRGEDSLRLYQVQQLLAWIDSRERVPAIVCGDFNAPLTLQSASLMASRFRPTQTAPTAFTPPQPAAPALIPLADAAGAVTPPYWPRMDRCIDYIWLSQQIGVAASGVCFNKSNSDDPSLWPSDHAGVWADLDLT